MRLKSIKLAGFKSFVDPTTVTFDTNLTAIVGPNGCGKSNIVDAIRWVTGESSAKQLRGDAITDVIFNGTVNRKPVSQASVELIFDNSDGSLGGEYAAYHEISIRRQLGMDGVSNYFLNGARCRRKDIVNVFLGTGLGPRSYAIIEQGMISRLIEAKPEQLRVNFEEAAGISKYKERRRETENRMQHTRDNLDRLTDLREELDKQLTHLKRQANAAERFKELKQNERQLKAELNALHWRDINAAFEQRQQLIQQEENKLEEHIAKQRHIEADIETLRAKQITANENFHAIQTSYYQAGADLASVEQQISHAQEKRARLETNISEVDHHYQETEQTLIDEEKRVAELHREITTLAPNLNELQQKAQTAQAELNSAEESMRHLQSQWEIFTHEAAKTERSKDVEQTRVEHMEQNIIELSQKIQNLQAEQVDTRDHALNHEIAEMKQTAEQTSQAREQIGLQLEESHRNIGEKRNQRSQKQQSLDQARSVLNQLRAEYAALFAKQQAALGQDDQAKIDWLRQHDLNAKPRLIEKMQVADGWHVAVETVLAAQLEAICVDHIDSLQHLVADFSQGNLSFISAEDAVFQPDHHKGITLASKINSDLNLASLLAGIYVADDLQQALSLRARLDSNESVITQDGIWLGNNWLKVLRLKDIKTGVLDQQQRLKILSAQVEAQASVVLDAEADLKALHEALHQTEQLREELQLRFNRFSQKYADLQTEMATKQSQLKHLELRQQQINNELLDAQTKFNATQTQLQQVRENWQEMKLKAVGHEENRLQIRSQRDHASENLAMKRQVAYELKRQSDESEIRIHANRDQLNYLEENIERTKRILAQLSDRKANLMEEAQQSLAPIQMAKEKLALLAKQRLEIENRMNQAKIAVDDINHDLHAQESLHKQVLAVVETLRLNLEKIRLEAQANEVRRENFVTAISELGFELGAILANLDGAASTSDWLQQIETVERKIERLGPINLAAIEEYDQIAQRKGYLDSQHEDLIQALSMLEEAIEKIDKETKSRLKETFEMASRNFAEIFPKIFNGGKASLELTTTDWLTTGMIVKAQPPGKRNSTIHLLSGGEKALTAIALVFAIFQLNPAPFCILDEVDAPLDDVNVGRYSNLVKEMSASIQFIFISHNKVSIEMASQLAGVTMNEPGVSRLVSVDIEEAMALAQQ